MCESTCQCNCTTSVSMYCSLPSPDLMSCSANNCRNHSLCCNVHVISPVVSCNSTTTTTQKMEDQVEPTTTSTQPSIINFFQTSSLTQSTSSSLKSENTTSRYSSIKSKKTSSITPNFTTLLSTESTISISINSISTHNYKLVSTIMISSASVDPTTTIIHQNAINISPSNFESTQSTLNIVQSIIDTNQRDDGTNTSTIITISVTVVVLSIILILIVIIIVFSVVMIVKRRKKYNLGK